MALIFRSRAPLRIGLAGGGTDVSPYSDVYGGVILNATISMFAYATIEIELGRKPGEPIEIIFFTADRNEKYHTQMDPIALMPIEGQFILHKGIFNWLVATHGRLFADALERVSSLKLMTYVDAPAGSGLGTSSTLVVAILSAFSEWLSLPLGEYDLAHTAYEIERNDLQLAGGKQDQYAATFGGFNFMEFYSADKVIVNPLRIKPDYIRELEFNVLLFYTDTSRFSSEIIQDQATNISRRRQSSIDSMHKLKEQAVLMKEALLKGHIDKMGELLHFGWMHKKQTANSVSNPLIDEIYQVALDAGATGGKISGAGGGGFMMFYCPENTRYSVIEALGKFRGEFRRFQFTQEGAMSWHLTRP